MDEDRPRWKINVRSLKRVLGLLIATAGERVELERYVVLELRVLYDDDPMEGPGKIRFDRFSGGPTTDVILVKLSYLWF